MLCVQRARDCFWALWRLNSFNRNNFDVAYDFYSQKSKLTNKKLIAQMLQTKRILIWCILYEHLKRRIIIITAFAAMYSMADCIILFQYYRYGECYEQFYFIGKGSRSTHSALNRTDERPCHRFCDVAIVLNRNYRQDIIKDSRTYSEGINIDRY